MTGVDGLDGGEVGGVLSLSMEGESGLLIAGDDGGWLGGQLVGVMPGIFGGLDINLGWVVGEEYLGMVLVRLKPGVFSDQNLLLIRVLVAAD